MLDEKIVWITGSGRGIGRAAALTLARRGARVVVSARSQGEIESVAAEAKKSSLSVLPVQCDVTDEGQIKKLVQTVNDTWGPVDVLVNNAGTAVFKKIIDMKESDWDLMMAANTKSAFLCTQAVLPAMIERQQGHIINVISVAGRQPFYNGGGYCASKYAMDGFTQVLRLETRKYGIQTTAFLPGATDTAIWGDANVDRGRMMTPDQVANVIEHICCSDPATMVEDVVLRPIGGDL
jgi:3-oxoacyl-[acyl-carrier protein] reductase